MNAVGFVTAGDVGPVLLAGLAFGSHQWPVVAVFRCLVVAGARVGSHHGASVVVWCSFSKINCSRSSAIFWLTK